MPRRFFSSEPHETEEQQEANDLTAVPFLNKVNSKEEKENPQPFGT